MPRLSRRVGRPSRCPSHLATDCQRNQAILVDAVQGTWAPFFFQFCCSHTMAQTAMQLATERGSKDIEPVDIHNARDQVPRGEQGRRKHRLNMCAVGARWGQRRTGQEPGSASRRRGRKEACMRMAGVGGRVSPDAVSRVVHPRPRQKLIPTLLPRSGFVDGTDGSCSLLIPFRAARPKPNLLPRTRTPRSPRPRSG